MSAYTLSRSIGREVRPGRVAKKTNKEKKRKTKAPQRVVTSYTYVYFPMLNAMLGLRPAQPVIQ